MISIIENVGYVGCYIFLIDSMHAHYKTIYQLHCGQYLDHKATSLTCSFSYSSKEISMVLVLV